MKPLAAIALAFATLLALAAFFGGRPAAADGPYLPPDPVAVPFTPLPPTPTPTGTILVYHCGREELQNPPAPQAIWGTVEGRTIKLHWSMSGSDPMPILIEVEFSQADREPTYIVRKDVAEFGPITFVAPYTGPFLVYPRFVYPCHSGGERISYITSAPGKTIDGETPFFFVRE